MDYVYHYTTAKGFKGIVESQEIWATSIYHLNDWTEFDHGRDAIMRGVEPLLKNEELFEAVAQLLSYLHELHPPLFVCSFSGAEDGDDLAQWRAYAPAGGYAIGLPLIELRTHAVMEGFDWMWCEYNVATAQGAATAFAAVMQQIIEKAGGPEKFSSQVRSGCWYTHDWYTDERLALLLKFVAKYKHGAFGEEKEFRLVSLLASGAQQSFRISSGVLVPYVALRLNNKVLWERAKIVISPCLPDVAKLRHESTRVFLESKLAERNLPTDCARGIRLSNAPYRSTTFGE